MPFYKVATSQQSIKIKTIKSQQTSINNQSSQNNQDNSSSNTTGETIVMGTVTRLARATVVPFLMSHNLPRVTRSLPPFPRSMHCINRFNLSIRPLSSSVQADISKTCSEEAEMVRSLADVEDAIMDALRKIHPANNDRDIVTLGCIRDLRVTLPSDTVPITKASLNFMVPKTVSIASEIDQLRDQLRDVTANTLRTPSSAITVNTIRSGTSKTQSDVNKSPNGGLAQVKHIIAVYSCKGGVGKSTVAVNLAASLKALGLRVGLLDADISGPSLPTMMIPPSHKIPSPESPDGTWMSPIQCHGISCMSYGFLSKSGSRKGEVASAIRGPMISNILKQLMFMTQWGEKDYLVLDLPPGTGDIHLTLLQQQVKLSGTVIVTTPQQLSYIDVVRGINLFQGLNVPTLAVVENMAWFRGDDGKVYHPFGDGHCDKLKSEYDIPHSFSLPILRDTSLAGDSGIPMVVQHPNSDSSLEFHNLAVTMYSDLQEPVKERTSFKIDHNTGNLICRIMRDDSAEEYKISCNKLRNSLDEVDKMIASPSRGENKVEPISVHKKGAYGITIRWSDGYDASIYSIVDVLKLAKQNKQLQ